MNTPRILAAVLALTAVAAAAQNYVVQPPITQTYVPLSAATIVTLTETDDGFAIIPLGFTFPYYGQSYTTVHANTNGFIAFGNTALCETGLGCYDGQSIPLVNRTTTNIHNVIAPWWDDLSLVAPGVVRYQQSPGAIEIEYANVKNLGSTYTMSFTIKLSSAGTIEIRYGAYTMTSSSTVTATAGFENATGSMGADLLGCSITTAACAQANWPTNKVYVIGQPVEADIVTTAVNLSNLVIGGTGNLTFDVTPTFQNYGQTAATGFQWKAYLSNDAIFDALDPVVFTSSTPVSLTPAGTASAIGSATGAAATLTAPAAGQYYVFVEADTTGVVMEASELNNRGRTLTYFVNGLDLVATSVSGPANSGPGNTITVNHKWFNQGTSAPAGPVTVQILLVPNNTTATTGFVIYTGTRTITGAETVDQDLTITLPANIPGGDSYFLLKLDPLSAIPNEATKANNNVYSVGKISLKQADLVNLATDFLDPLTGAPSRIGYFGQPARATVNMSNVGGANANNFSVCVVVSTDATLSLLSDTIAAEITVPTLAAAATATLDIPFTMPLKDKASVDFPTGNYYLFTILNCNGAVADLNPVNNNLPIAGTVQLRAPAPDLTVTKVEAPASGGVGEVIPVLRTLKNIGNVAAGAAKYRYFASANAIITGDDIPLQIMNGGSGTLDGTVTLGIGVSDTQTELVKLPGTMSPGTYTIGVVVDLGNAVPEIDEQNNSGASSTLVIANASLRVSTSQLPDAVVDRSYSYHLVALGEQGSSTWAVDATQGALPMGLALSADGLLTGTPTVPSVNAFTVTVTNNGRDASARLVLRVLPTTTQVEITSTFLTAVVNLPSERYETKLGAAGGVKPYAWKIVSGTLPQNLVFSTDGILSGFPRLGLTESTTTLTFEVTDSLGTKAQKTLPLRVVPPGSILFKNLSLPDGLVGEDYSTDVAVANADLTLFAAMQKPIVWTRAGELPDGLTMMPSGDVLLIEGKPLRAGAFVFSLTAEDAKGRSDTAEFIVRISPSRFKLSSVGLPDPVRPGATVDFAITSSSQANPTFAVVSGSLAPGLTMAADGKVTGTVPADAANGTYNFTVEGKDTTGATGLAGFFINVQKEARATGCGCSTGLDGLWMLAALLPLAARRRRVK